MKTAAKIAFGGYLIIAIAVVASGLRYFCASQIMPYHLAAIGTTWENLSPGAQIMTLNFMKAAGSGFLMAGIAIGILLFIPFRKGEPWSRWALLVISLGELILITLRILNVRMNTPATPPLVPCIVLIGIAVMSFLFSLAGMKSRPKQSL